MPTTDALTIEMPSGIVHATAGPRRTAAVVFELHGAMRGSVHVTGTQHPRYWDQFTAVRACLGLADAYETTAPDDDLPRFAHGRSGYHGSLTRYPSDYGGRPEVSVYPLSTAAGKAVIEDGRDAHRRSARVRRHRRPARRPAPDPERVQAVQDTWTAAVPQLGRSERRR
ncbi:hypothetical protein ABZ904_29195 [Streptomyces sp. NPDC046900]|uniref:hypothetical protein n=1 Tax=Streptomyces sp. NPDC046900 TaxID=3155473 RepID=UPI0033F68A40